MNEIDEAFKFADQDSFQNQKLRKNLSMNSSRNITLSDALCEATHQAMNENKNVFVIGGALQIQKLFWNKDLVTKFGLDRVIEAPLAENGLTDFVLEVLCLE